MSGYVNTSPVPASADEYDFNRAKMSFENFIRCELTRTDADDHFNGRAFEITMINFYDIQAESDIKIVTGAVECFVEKKHHTLFVALGLKRVLGKEKVSYYVIRTKDFRILATELIQHPYKERCPWSEYWIDLD
ncbi:MAG: hypothetical protein D3926_17465 [Desulfobacteraceae bacterium]|nr:MAG: hypothetical protein D3926_17465 [Desulfobacteraceae bacterium]